MARVREDERGIFVIQNGLRFRPGPVNGYAHAYDMSDGGIKKGDMVKARHVSQSMLVRIRLDDGRVLHWYGEPLPRN